MVNFIEELYYGNIEPQNRKRRESRNYSREMKVLSENETCFWKSFRWKTRNYSSNMLTHGELLTENPLLIALLQDSDWVRDLLMMYSCCRKTAC